MVSRCDPPEDLKKKIVEIVEIDSENSTKR